MNPDSGCNAAFTFKHIKLCLWAKKKGGEILNVQLLPHPRVTDTTAVIAPTGIKPLYPRSFPKSICRAEEKKSLFFFLLLLN